MFPWEIDIWLKKTEQKIVGNAIVKSTYKQRACHPAPVMLLDGFLFEPRTHWTVPQAFDRSMVEIDFSIEIWFKQDKTKFDNKTTTMRSWMFLL